MAHHDMNMRSIREKIHLVSNHASYQATDDWRPLNMDGCPEKILEHSNIKEKILEHSNIKEIQTWMNVQVRHGNI